MEGCIPIGSFNGLFSQHLREVLARSCDSEHTFCLLLPMPCVGSTTAYVLPSDRTGVVDEAQLVFMLDVLFSCRISRFSDGAVDARVVHHRLGLTKMLPQKLSSAACTVQRE